MVVEVSVIETESVALPVRLYAPSNPFTPLERLKVLDQLRLVQAVKVARLRGNCSPFSFNEVKGSFTILPAA